jgi:hypothetical protein
LRSSTREIDRRAKAIMLKDNEYENYHEIVEENFKGPARYGPKTVVVGENSEMTVPDQPYERGMPDQTSDGLTYNVVGDNCEDEHSLWRDSTPLPEIIGYGGEDTVHDCMTNSNYTRSGTTGAQCEPSNISSQSLELSPEDRTGESAIAQTSCKWTKRFAHSGTFREDFECARDTRSDELSASVVNVVEACRCKEILPEPLKDAGLASHVDDRHGANAGRSRSSQSTALRSSVKSSNGKTVAHDRAKHRGEVQHKRHRFKALAPSEPERSLKQEVCTLSTPINSQQSRLCISSAFADDDDELFEALLHTPTSHSRKGVAVKPTISPPVKVVTGVDSPHCSQTGQKCTRSYCMLCIHNDTI